jgi:anthranilate synthase component 2
MILVIDNYDSFTYNLVHYLAELGAEPVVRRNDALTAADALAMRPGGDPPLPRPLRPGAGGICLPLLDAAPPTFRSCGVCLGHQAIGEAFGGDVIRARTLMHGKTSPIRHDDTGVFAGLPDGFTGTRYHSLAVDRASLPAVLEINAWTEDGEIMGLRHRDRPGPRASSSTPSRSPPKAATSCWPTSSTRRRQAAGGGLMQGAWSRNQKRGGPSFCLCHPGRARWSGRRAGTSTAPQICAGSACAYPARGYEQASRPGVRTAAPAQPSGPSGAALTTCPRPGSALTRCPG